MELALTWDREDPPAADLWQAVRPRFYNVYYPLITRELVAEVHRHGCEVSAWTVNDFTEMARLLGMGVDAVVTDHPAELAQLAGGQREHTSAHQDRAARPAAEPPHQRRGW
ncbi:glycerophosphodiester phosphodiesterase [Allosalinactinospora lopnorensis]|uniref:glycerophosphodiester phosphodiesterase n=1 Tax=Allosalinactinospora lopnorensis TaxID=1352348 RepID=UPI000699148C|nr:glycerophosphodiester phosphodiesterase [Allosalinactinospora lopnorensis]